MPEIFKLIVIYMSKPLSINLTKCLCFLCQLPLITINACCILFLKECREDQGHWKYFSMAYIICLKISTSRLCYFCHFLITFKNSFRMCSAKYLSEKYPKIQVAVTRGGL